MVAGFGGRLVVVVVVVVVVSGRCFWWWWCETRVAGWFGVVRLGLESVLEVGSCVVSGGGRV